MAKKKTATKKKAATKKAAPARKSIKPTAKRAAQPAKAAAKPVAKKKPAKRRSSIDPATAPTSAAGIKFINSKRGNTTGIRVGLNIPGNDPDAVPLIAACPPAMGLGVATASKTINGNIDSVSVYVGGVSVYSATYPDSGAVQSVVIQMDGLDNFSSCGLTNSNFTGTQVPPVSTGN